MRKTPFGVQSYRRLPTDTPLHQDYEFEIQVESLRNSSINFRAGSKKGIVVAGVEDTASTEIQEKIRPGTELSAINDTDITQINFTKPPSPETLALLQSSPAKLRFRPPRNAYDWRIQTWIGASEREKAYHGDLDDEDPLFTQAKEDMKFLELDEKEMELEIQANIELAQMEIDKRLGKQSEGELLRKCWNIVFDLSCAVISIVDVVTDILVTLQFYRNPEQRVFFYLSASVFVLAQLSYSFWFACSYVLHERLLKFVCVMISIFPIAQLVPIFMWLDSYHFSWFKQLKSCLRLSNSSPLDYKPLIHLQEADRLSTWLEEKMITHSGFIIEAVIEGFPQSIIQMIAIVVFQRASPLNVFSIILSMLSVASKTIVFAYSVDKFSFVFKFLCMVLDVFNIFAVLSWVFFNPEKHAVISLFGKIWLWKMGLMLGLIVLFGLVLLMMSMIGCCVQCGSQYSYRQIFLEPCLHCVRFFGRSCRSCFEGILHEISRCLECLPRCCCECVPVCVRRCFCECLPRVVGSVAGVIVDCWGRYSDWYVRKMSCFR